MGFKWIKIHTHIHTINSDGKDTLSDMAIAAKNVSIDAMLLTDHNTIAISQNVEDISKEINIKIVNGIEYTTFYGHIIVVGAPYYRWDNLKNNSLNELADHVHSYNGIIGIAHPMGIGDPVCTGGRYSFKDVDFSKIDFIEVWHGVTNKFNEWEKNQNFWIGRLNEEKNITALYGGDFHKKEHFTESNTFNWMLIDETKSIEDAIKEAIKSGRVVMSQGPCFHMKIEKDKHIYNMGEIIELKKNDTTYNIILDVEAITIDRSILINLVDNSGQVKEVEYNKNNKTNIEICANDKVKWIRAEIVDEINKEVLAVSNPIYFKYV